MAEGFALLSVSCALLSWACALIATRNYRAFSSITPCQCKRANRYPAIKQDGTLVWPTND